MKFHALALTAFFVALPAMAEEMHHGDHAAPMTPAAAALAAANDKMMTDMTVAFSGNPDRDFILMMIPHHEGAIEMAKVQIQYGTDAEIRKLAEGIIAAQEAEIAEMKAWLAEHPE